MWALASFVATILIFRLGLFLILNYFFLIILLGWRKTLRRDILWNFLAVSGLFGWLGAYGIAALVNLLPKQEMFGGLPVSGVTTTVAFAALGVVAILSAVWPAWRAASLTPVEALRYER